MSSISCIITSYNNQDYIQDAVLSVINQSMPVSEIIIADDCSRDRSREIVRSLANKHPQITTIFRDKNLGVSANRDLAIAAAKGDLVTTLDGDDLYFQDKIEKEYAAMQKHNCSIAYSDIQFFDSERESILYQDISKFASLSRLEKLDWLASRLGPIPKDMLLAKKMYLEVGGMNHSINRYEDWDFKIRLTDRYSNWAYSGVAGTAYRRTGSGLSTMNPLNHVKHQYRVLQLNRDLLVREIGYSRFGKSLARVLYRNGRSGIKKMAPQFFINLLEASKLKQV